ncbi:MAG: hypothetical protein M1388_01700 [Thaumarchaeota archaeon]|nr:hypothetical protein [Nitrososphaerota archaeon]
MLSAFGLYPNEGRKKVLNGRLQICKELYNGAASQRLELCWTGGKALATLTRYKALTVDKEDTLN